MKTVVLHDRKPDRMERFLQFYLEGKKLNPKQEATRLEFEQAHSLRIMGLSREQTVRMLLGRKICGSLREAYRAVSGAEQLFGDLNKVHKDGLRHIITENLQRIYNKAMESGNLKDANKSQETIAKINNLINPDFVPFDYTKLVIPIPVYTTNAQVLKDQETLDIPHEEVDSE